jgi:hypothetical protein
MMTREGKMKTGIERIGRIAAPLALILMLTGALPGMAQTVAGEPQDLQFEIINATTGEGAAVERLTIDYVTARANNMVDIEPADTTFTVKSVPIKEGGKYLLTVWYQDVPYWWSKRGRELTGGPVTLHVFDTVPQAADVSIGGLNLVIRHQESLVRLEYMIQVDNLAKPQVTVLGPTSTFDLALPDGATDIEAVYNRGPEPTPVPVQGSGRRSGLSLPLTPGQNMIRLEAVVPWAEGMIIPVGSNLAVRSWSVLASPERLEIGSTDMEENDSEEVPGFRRFAGFPLEAGKTVNLRLNSGPQATGPAEDLFTQDAPTDQEDAGESGELAKGGGMSLPLIFVGVLIILIIVATVRRRS